MAENSAARAPLSRGVESRADAAGPSDLPPFAKVYEQYFDFVWTTAKRLGVAPEAMDDVVQEAFVIIHFRLGTVQHPESLRSWIYGVVRRTVSGYHRSRKTKKASPCCWFDESFESSQLTPFDHRDQRDQMKVLAELVNTLDEPQREIFVLTELEEMTAPEIAAALAIPLNTVYSRLRAGRLAFEHALVRYVAREKGERA